MLLEQKISIDSLRSCFERKGYELQSQPQKINTIGIRSADMTPNTFNDFLCALWFNTSEKWQLEFYKATTEPGVFYLQNPANVNGTGILAEGQYISAFEIGLHKNLYRCLVQRLPVKVYRDRNKDNRFDLDPTTIESGMFGIQIHRASAGHESTVVANWSAACQVIAHPTNFDRFMELCHESGRLYGNRFDYTLINETDLQ